MKKRPAFSIALLAAMIALLVSAVASAGTMTVTVEGLRSDEGVVRVAIYDGPDGFPDRNAIFRIASIRSHNRQAKAVFTGLAPGRYAIAVHHDEDIDDEFDMFLFLPVEGFGFGNDAPLGFGPPSFDAASADVGVDGKDLVVHIRY